MSTFTNITISDTVTADTVVCDSLITNSALSSTTYGGITVQTNTIKPYTGNLITINGPTASLDTLDINSRLVMFEGNVNIAGTTFTKDINAGLSNITGGNLIITNNIVGSFLTLSNLNAGNVIANYANINNVFIGSSASYTQTTGTSLAISQNTSFDNTVNGAISGNVYPQFSFGSGREHLFATDVGNANISYYGISDLTAPDSDFMITYKNKVGMKISPTPTNTDFTEALRVVGTANISGNCMIGNIQSGIIKSGNIYQDYTVNSPRNSTIHTTHIEPSENNTSDFLLIKAYSQGTGYIAMYGPIIYQFGKSVCENGANVSGTLDVLGNLFVSTSANIIGLRGTGNSEIGYGALNRKVKIGAVNSTIQRISFYGSSNITAENLNGYIEIDGASNGATTQNQGVLNMVAGNITMGTVNSQSFILYNKNVEIQGNINALSNLTVSGSLKFNELYNTNVRIGEAWGPIFSGAVVTIPNGGLIPFTAPIYGTLDGLDATARWIRVNKNGQSLTVGVKLTFIFEINTGFTNTSGGFQVQTSTTSTFTTPSGRTFTRVVGTFVSSDVIERTLDFILPLTEEYFRVFYTGNSAWSFVGGQSTGYLSRYSVRTYL